MKLIFSSLLVLTGAFACHAQSPSPTPNVGVVNGKAIKLVKPDYPRAAAAIRASGIVPVQVTIGEDGNVISASAVGGHPLLKAAAEAAARESKFTPTYIAGQAVKVSGVINYNFAPGAGSGGRNPAEPVYAYDPSKAVIRVAAPNPKIEKTNWLRWSITLTNISQDYTDLTIPRAQSLAFSLPASLLSEKELLNKISGDDMYRTKIVSDIYSLLENKLDKSDLWQLKLGRAIGNIAYVTRYAIFNDGYALDADLLRADLKTIKELKGNVPDDFPVDLGEPMEKLAALSEASDLKSPDSLITIARNFQKVFDKISINNLK